MGVTTLIAAVKYVCVGRGGRGGGNVCGGDCVCGCVLLCG